MSSTNSVVEFPVPSAQRLEAAIKLFDTRQDPTRALREFLALIDEGCHEAYFFAACLFEDGGHGIEKDLEKALFYYRKSIDEFGYTEGYLALGRFYYYGISVPSDYKKAFEYYAVVADQKDNAIAQLMLGRMYQRGEGVEKDLIKARSYYDKAIADGNVYAIQNLAFLEEELGHRFRGLWLRIKAGLIAFNIGGKNMKDARLRRG